MNIHKLKYLKQILGDSNIIKYLNFSEEKLDYLINILKSTSIKEQLNKEELDEFCYSILLGDYGKTLATILCYIDIIPRDKRKQSEYKELIKMYNDEGWDDEIEYLNTFDYFKNSTITNRFEFDFPLFEKLMYEEIYKVKKEEEKHSTEYSVEELLDNGLTLDELIPIILKNGNMYTEFNLDSRYSIDSKKEDIYLEYQTSWDNINKLVSRLYSLNISKETKLELMTVYFDNLDNNDLINNNVITITNHPNLYDLLNQKGYLEDYNFKKGNIKTLKR